MAASDHDPSFTITIKSSSESIDEEEVYRSGELDHPEDLAIANIKESNPLACIFSLVKTLVIHGNIKQCPGHLDLSSCRSDLSTFALFRLAWSLIHIKTLTYFSRRPRHDQDRAKPTTPPVIFQQLKLMMSDVKNGVDNMNHLDNEATAQRMAKLCVMASMLAYENESVVKDVVTTTWKMKFVEFFNSWNEYLQANSTQAFIFTNKDQDADIVIVAFRGTEMSSLQDWATDFDFSYYNIPGLGRVHMGFLEALGLGTRLDKSTLQRTKINTILKANMNRRDYYPTSGLAKEKPNEGKNVLAYDAISMSLESILSTNPRAKLYVTGHSLGGALATLFIAFRLFENNGEDPRLGGVFTFGQPRVGDESFTNYMEAKLSQNIDHKRKYFRVVFRTDIVPRLPEDNFIFQFKHITPCHFYKSDNESEVLREQPYNNMMLNILQPMPHLSAMKELSQSLIQRSRSSSSNETNIVPLLTRFLAVFSPSMTAHSLVYYIAAITNAPSSFLGQTNQDH